MECRSDRGIYLIKYCCFYCKKLNTSECGRGCYNALGGRKYFEACQRDNTCVVANSQCATVFPFEKKTYKIHPFELCWEPK
jgi:hypothetical protein